jgi:LiaF transmembrane domain
MPLRFSPEGLVVGLSLVGVGVIEVLSDLGRVDFLAALHTWWPTTLVVWGAAELLKTWQDRSGRAR